MQALAGLEHRAVFWCEAVLDSKKLVESASTSHYAELLAGLSPRLGQKCKQPQTFTECPEAPAEWFVWTEMLLHACSSWL